MNTGSIELIDFYRPDGSRKNLFISNIPGSLSAEDITAQFYEVFSKYGLLYGVQLFPSSFKFPQKHECETGNQPTVGFYAFVTFYSSTAAALAKEELNHSVTIDNTVCKISYAKRKKEVTERPVLHFTRCYDLLSFYLGFNSWSTSIKTLFEEKLADTENTGIVKYVCVTSLKVCDLQTDGIGVAQETYVKTDPISKIKTTGVCKKQSQQRSVENAFSKMILVVLGNGKVTVEVDTTKPEPLMQDHVKEDQLIKVNELDSLPSSEDLDEEASEKAPGVSDSDLDDLNIHILQELGEDM